jgi:hypothetical protein
MSTGAAVEVAQGTEGFRFAVATETAAPQRRRKREDDEPGTSAPPPPPPSVAAAAPPTVTNAAGFVQSRAAGGGAVAASSWSTTSGATSMPSFGFGAASSGGFGFGAAAGSAPATAATNFGFGSAAGTSPMNFGFGAAPTTATTAVAASFGASTAAATATPSVLPSTAIPVALYNASRYAPVTPLPPDADLVPCPVLFKRAAGSSDAAIGTVVKVDRDGDFLVFVSHSEDGDIGDGPVAGSVVLVPRTNVLGRAAAIIKRQ